MRRSPLSLLLLLVMGPQGCDDGEPPATPIDASTEGGAEASTEAGPITDGGPIDADSSSPMFGDEGPPNAPLFFNADSEVTALVHADKAWYIGGRAITEVTRHAGPGLMQLSATGTPVPCLLGAGFGDSPVGGRGGSDLALPDGGLTGVVDGPWEHRIHVVLQVGNSLYVGGNFTHYKAEPAQNLAKLDATTCALDKTFTTSSGFDATVLSLAYDGGSLYVGGRFDMYRGAPAHRLAKIDADSGTLDTTFTQPDSGFDHPVEALLVRGSALYAGGSFRKYRLAPARALAKLDRVSGALDSGFMGPGFDLDASSCEGVITNPKIYDNCMRDVRVTALAASGSALYVGGRFSKLKDHAVGSLVKLDVLSGAVDATFSPAPAFETPPLGHSDAGAASEPAPVHALALWGGSLYAGGTFTRYRGAHDASRIAKIDATTGTLDPAFSPLNNGFDGTVHALVVTGGSLFVGGAFDSYRGVAGSARGIAKLELASGALDATFKPAGADLNGFDGDVQVLASAGNTVWAAGRFTRFAGHRVKNLVKVDDTTFEVDTTFSPADMGFDGAIEALAASASSLYVGGSFTTYRAAAGSASRLAKLDLASGALDTAFSPAGSDANGFDDQVSSLALEGTSLYVGGRFTAYRGAAGSAPRIAKLDATTGALVTAFTPAGPNGFEQEQGTADVLALVVDGSSVYAGGKFTTYRGVTLGTKNIVKLDRVGGALETTFSPTDFDETSPDPVVQGLHLAGGSLFVRGSFRLLPVGGGYGFDFVVVDPMTGARRFSSVDAGGGIRINDWGRSGDYFVSSSDSLYGGLAKLDLATGALDPAFVLDVVGSFSAAALNDGSLYLASSRPYRALMRFDPKTGAPE